MTNENTPVFSSPDLQKAVDAARPLLEGADDAMNRVSNDIKALETWLKGLKLHHPYWHSLGKGAVSSPEMQAGLSEFGAADCEILEEALSWSPDKNGTYRLFYEENIWEGAIDVDHPGGPLFWNDSTLKQTRKPLIEMPFEVRKRIHQNNLARFVAAMAEDHRLEKVEVPSDEIPY